MRMTFSTWLARAASFLTEWEVRSVGVSDGRWTAAKLLNDRADEPRDCYDAGDTAYRYAKELREEYDLFGPEGE